MSIYDPSIERTIRAFRRDNNDDVLNELGGNFRDPKAKSKTYKFNAFTPMSGGNGAQHGPRLKYIAPNGKECVFPINRNTMGIMFKDIKDRDNVLKSNDGKIILDLAGAVAIYAFDIIMALFENKITQFESENAMVKRGDSFSALTNDEIKELIKRGRNLIEY